MKKISYMPWVAIPGICLTMATNSFGLPTMTGYRTFGATDIETALSNVRASCGGISEELNQMKTMAGIGTGVSAVGAVASGAAVATGVMKQNVDDDHERLNARIKQLIAEDGNPPAYVLANKDALFREIDEYLNGVTIDDAGNIDTSNALVDDKYAKKLEEMDKKSEKLGNIRTGTLAATTAANIAGAAVGGVNMKKARGSLTEQVSECLASVKELSAAYGQARITRTASDEDLGRIETIVRVCNEWSTVDLSKIDKRATGSFASSVVGAATGTAGTITSALANSQNIRAANDQKEKNLNFTANVMAGGATVASLTATMFNAAQISVIKRASTVADACEGALN